MRKPVRVAGEATFRSIQCALTKESLLLLYFQCSDLKPTEYKEESTGLGAQSRRAWSTGYGLWTLGKLLTLSQPQLPPPSGWGHNTKHIGL